MVDPDMTLDLLLVNPGGRDKVYQDLGADLAAVEPPLWCRLIAGYARDRDCSVAILDSEAQGLGPEALAAQVAALRPRLVAIVVFGHQPSASTQQMVGAREAAAALKDRAPDLPVLIVGGHVAALPERTLTEEPIDFACNGEGPVTVAQLVTWLRAGDSPDGLAAIEGLVWRDPSGAIRSNPPAALIRDLDRDLHGQVWDLLPMDKYRAHNWQCFGDLTARQPYASVYTSLGCPYKCTFCCINAPFGVNRYRMRSPKAVAEEIAELYHRYGVKTFKIIDEMFVLNERHVTGVCDAIISQRLSGLNIWAYARVDTVKPAMLAKLREAGITWLALGIESGSAHVRDGADKSFSQDDIFAIVRQIQKAGINVIGNFIFGLPDDDLASMQATLQLAKDLNCEFANFYSAMAYPGSALYRMAVDAGWKLPDSWSGYSQHSYDCTPLPTAHLSAADVLRFRDRAFHEYFATPRYLDMVAQRFGWEARRHVEDMAKTRLKRKLLEAPSDPAGGEAKVASAA
jgi:radical SAM superfamily enzyme YgiQ (UPF0313 family)